MRGKEGCSYEHISIGAVDDILANLMAQPVAVRGLAAHYRVVQMYKKIRWMKRAELSR